MDRIFDCHVHTFPDTVAAKAIPLLAERSGGLVPAYDGTLAGLTATMREAGIAGALNCPIATKSTQVESVNTWAAAHNRWPVLSLGSMHPAYPDMERELSRIRDLGLPGIKLHPEYQEFTLDDPRMTPVWRVCRDLGLVVLIHAGADIAFSPPYHTDPERIRAWIEAWPGLTVIAAHFGSWKMWDRVATELIGRPIYLDLSFLFGLCSDTAIKDMIRRHGVERVLFGTDAPWRDPEKEVTRLPALGLTPDELEAICWKNAARLLGFG
ncbi:MAG: amidohydrolase family protein [Kiritimatiellaeota bacterium]|nr:amidohydrolase family protein [Kiritimatiellota bacterium]